MTAAPALRPESWQLTDLLDRAPGLHVLAGTLADLVDEGIPSSSARPTSSTPTAWSASRSGTPGGTSSSASPSSTWSRPPPPGRHRAPAVRRDLRLVPRAARVRADPHRHRVHAAAGPADRPPCRDHPRLLRHVPPRDRGPGDHAEHRGTDRRRAADAAQLGSALRAATACPGPVYFRIGRGQDPDVYREGDPRFEIGKAIEHGRGDDLTIVATGSMVHPALGAAAKLNAAGVSAGVLDMHTVKPLDETAVLDAARRSGLLLTVEEHSVLGGLGGAVAETVTGAGVGARVVRHGIADEYALIGPRRTSTATTASTPRASRRRHCERSAGSGDRPLGPGIRDLRPGTAAARRSSVEVDITPPGSGGEPNAESGHRGHRWVSARLACSGLGRRLRRPAPAVPGLGARVPRTGGGRHDPARRAAPLVAERRTCSPRRCSTR